MYHDLASSVMKEDVNSFESEMLKELRTTTKNPNQKIKRTMIDSSDDKFSFISMQR